MTGASRRVLIFFKTVFACGLFGYGLFLCFHPSFYDRVQYANLTFHEYGHMFFGLFRNETLTALGGSLMQLLIPAALFWEFTRRKDRYSASIVLFWIGHNLFNISNYVKDARMMELPLFTPNAFSFFSEDVVGHDWNFLLGRAGLLAHDVQIGSFLWFCGCLTVLLGAAGAFCYAVDPLKAVKR